MSEAQDESINLMPFDSAQDTIRLLSQDGNLIPLGMACHERGLSEAQDESINLMPFDSAQDTIRLLSQDGNLIPLGMACHERGLSEAQDESNGGGGGSRTRVR